MTVELTPGEAEVLIAVLTYAEAVAALENPAMTEALKALRPWRSALIGAYLRERIGQSEPAEAEIAR